MPRCNLVQPCIIIPSRVRVFYGKILVYEEYEDLSFYTQLSPLICAPIQKMFLYCEIQIMFYVYEMYELNCPLSNTR